MGAWTFVGPKALPRTLNRGDFQYVGRDASASPATGSHTIHDLEQDELVKAAIGAAVPHLVAWNSAPRPVLFPPGRRPLRARIDFDGRRPPRSKSRAGQRIRVSSGVLVALAQGRRTPTVKADDPLYELDTDKASQVFTAPSSGRLKIGVELEPRANTVEVHAVIGSIDPDERGRGPDRLGAGKPSDDSASPAKRHRPELSPQRPPADAFTATAKASPPDHGPRPVGPLGSSPRPASTRAGDEGTGRDGRLTKGDVLAHLEWPPRPQAGRRPRPEAGRTKAPAATPEPARSRAEVGRPARVAQADDPDPPENRPAPGRSPAGNRRDPHHLQRGRPVEGHGAADQVQGRVQDQARRRPRLHVVLRQGRRSKPSRRSPQRQRSDRGEPTVVTNNVYDIGVAVSTDKRACSSPSCATPTSSPSPAD